MFNKTRTLQGYKLRGHDGEIGNVRDFYFDDQHWTIRYLIADTGDWLVDRQVLISPYALMDVERAGHTIAIDLTKKQIEGSPSLETDKPVSRQFEGEYYGYYKWPVYWGGPYMWGSYPYIMRDRDRLKESTQVEKPWDPHLRSIQEVSGYLIDALDGEIGHVEDFIIDDDTWAIRYLIVDTGNWWPGKQVLISPRWIERVSWTDSKVYVDLPRERIAQAPEYHEDALPTRDYEIGLHRHYDRPAYWDDDTTPGNHSHWRDPAEAREALTGF